MFQLKPSFLGDLPLPTFDWKANCKTSNEAISSWPSSRVLCHAPCLGAKLCGDAAAKAKGCIGAWVKSMEFNGNIRMKTIGSQYVSIPYLPGWFEYEMDVTSNWVESNTIYIILYHIYILEIHGNTRFVGNSALQVIDWICTSYVIVSLEMPLMLVACNWIAVPYNIYIINIYIIYIHIIYIYIYICNSIWTSRQASLMTLPAHWIRTHNPN